MTKALFLFLSGILYICNGLGARIYSSGLQSIGNFGLNISITIAVGTGDDGINITLTGDTPNRWIGIGFATGMALAPAVICENDVIVERQLGPPNAQAGAGTMLTSVGSGSSTCTNTGLSNTVLFWSLSGRNTTADDLYTFETDGSDIPIIYAQGSGAIFDYHGSRGKMVLTGFTCTGFCTTDEPSMTPSMTPSIAPSIAPSMTPSIAPTTLGDGGAGKIYAGEMVLFTANMFTVSIAIATGFDAIDSVTNGVAVQVTTNEIDYQYWIGVGFGSTIMEGTFALTCRDSISPNFFEQQLGPNNSGSPVTSIAGNGTCAVNGDITWYLDGYQSGDDIYTFPEDGSDIQLIYAYGNNGAFQRHNTFGRSNFTFSCVYGCSAPTPTNSVQNISPKLIILTVFIIIQFILL